MIHVSVWLDLLFLILILRQSAAASDQCSELQSKISRLENALHAATTQVHNYEVKAGKSDMSGYVREVMRFLQISPVVK
jgi:division protein CdvB (Snf7/Vps24/ESCRT-III family)